jgi:serine phosphatase RsbU (regulator of sigma subunit)
LETEELQLFELKGDKQPIGIHWEEKDFTSHSFNLQKQDTIYVFSDGIVDQFGGPDRKKFKIVNFKKLLLSVQEESMEKQKQLVENAFESWRNDFEQIDDVCVIGVRI